MVGALIDEIPLTEMQALYKELPFKRKGSSGARVMKADELLRDSGRSLADAFKNSVAEANEFFAEHDFGDQPLYPTPRKCKEPAGLTNSATFGCYLQKNRESKWKVPGDPSLDFHYVDRELVSTRAPGTRLKGGRSTRLGPRVDLLLANARTRHPILGEVKLTSSGAPDKDPFYALIQALASAAYLLPANQIKRLAHDTHDEAGRLAANATQLDLYLMIGLAPERSARWFDLRDRAEKLAKWIAPRISSHVPKIAGLELDWDGRAAAMDKLVVKKWFSTNDPAA